MAMTENCFDRVYRQLQVLAAEWSAGTPPSGADQMIRFLPDLFRLLRRVAYDLEMPGADRRLAAAAVLYIADPNDFLPDADEQSARRRLDDLWVAFAAFFLLVQSGAVSRIESHWRSEIPFRELLECRQRQAELGDALPPRILQMVNQYLQD